MERKRLVADRFRRIWHIAEDVAANPGSSRRELADKFHLSERQVQADLNIIRVDMALPLVRSQGYRFKGEGVAVGAGAFDLREVQLLVMVLASTRSNRSIPQDRVNVLATKLPRMFPLHLQPIADQLLRAVMQPQSVKHGQIFGALGAALMLGSYVKLHFPPGDTSSPVPEPIIKPEMLLPYLSSWYVVGEVQQRNRSMMLNLDAVTAVTIATSEGRS